MMVTNRTKEKRKKKMFPRPNHLGGGGDDDDNRFRRHERRGGDPRFVGRTFSSSIRGPSVGGLRPTG